MRRTAYLVAFFLCCAAAYAGTAHLYNLSDGKVSVIKFSRWRGSHGPHRMTQPSGENLSGEYSVVHGGALGWGSIYGSVFGTGGSASGSATSTSLAVSLRGEGSAILTGDKGTILNCEFISSGHGSGACEDNHGVKYKLMF
jgi:hypothetical protein